MFATQGFTEIVFCAVTSNEQVKVQILYSLFLCHISVHLYVDIHHIAVFRGSNFYLICGLDFLSSISGLYVAVWRSWQRRWSDQRSYSTPGPVSTGMGDQLEVQLFMREIYLSLTKHPGQLSLAIPPWVRAMSTGQRAVMLCDWGVKADMVLFAGNTV